MRTNTHVANKLAHISITLGDMVHNLDNKGDDYNSRVLETTLRELTNAEVELRNAKEKR